ncbi:MAG: D-Ala-D-Ala carboxypeptidase family metallohydrolase [Magnetococcus sp. DMHC-1]
MDYTNGALARAIASQSDMLLTTNFRLSELIYTSHKDVDNWPKDPVVINKLRYLCVHILEKVRTNFQSRPVIVNSGYRSEPLNKRIGGSTSSQHMKGEAVDFHINGIGNDSICKWVMGNLVFDQLILEFHTKGVPNSGWVHCSLVPTGNRRQVLTASKRAGKTQYLSGLFL